MGYTPTNNPYVAGDPYMYNMNWIVKKIKEAIKLYEPLAADFKELEEYVNNYFANLDVEQQIQDASTWHHDFGDGRGSIPSYGNWFLRLETPGFTGVGIHGSTNNEASVPGRDSEGCIRLRDADLDVLHDRYAQTGQAVIIKGIGEGKYPFEERARAALGDRYRGPVAGNKRQSDSPSTAVTAEGGSVIKRQEGGAVIKRQGADAQE